MSKIAIIAYNESNSYISDIMEELGIDEFNTDLTNEKYPRLKSKTNEIEMGLNELDHDCFIENSSEVSVLIIDLGVKAVNGESKSDRRFISEKLLSLKNSSDYVLQLIEINKTR